MGRSCSTHQRRAASRCGPSLTWPPGANAVSDTAGFRGHVLIYIVSQPTEVEMVMKAAIEAGAEVLEPTKKALVGSFSGLFRIPDGAIWKLASASNKDTGPAAQPPRPTETTIILGVEKPKASKAFYQALG